MGTVYPFNLQYLDIWVYSILVLVSSNNVDCRPTNEYCFLFQMIFSKIQNLLYMAKIQISPTYQSTPSSRNADATIFT